jgi:hypothetical protein
LSLSTDTPRKGTPRSPDSTRIGAFALHAIHDPKVTSLPGRVRAAAALDARLLAEIDERTPGLPEEERQRRLIYARSAHYARLALASKKARKADQGRKTSERMKEWWRAKKEKEAKDAS